MSISQETFRIDFGVINVCSQDVKRSVMNAATTATTFFDVLYLRKKFLTNSEWAIEN